MLRVPVKQVEPGMCLARPISEPDDPRRFLLHRGQEIPPDLVPQLIKRGIHEVWVQHPDLEFLEEINDEGLEERQREIYVQVRRNFEKIMPATNLEMDIHDFCLGLSDLFAYLKQSQCVNILMQKVGVYDNYLMSHSTNVCFLALLLGIKLESYITQEHSGGAAHEASLLQLLGLGCLIHDVGKVKIPPEILNKPTRLTDEEMSLIKLHPVFGFEMVKGQVPIIVADIVLNHHQRWNGEGYPERTDPISGVSLPPLKGKQISVFSRIATVADVYDAATSLRCYSGAKLPVQVLHEMQTFCHAFFDPIVADAFYKIVPPFPIGQLVTLTGGAQAVVVDFNPSVPTRPKVQIMMDPRGTSVRDPANHEIDLSLENDLDIVMVDHIDVRPFLPRSDRAGQPAPQSN